MLGAGTKVRILHTSWENRVGVVRGTIKLPKYPKGWQAGYIVRVGKDQVAFYPSLVRKAS